MNIKGYFLYGFMTVLLFHAVFSTSKGDAWCFSNLVIKVQINLIINEINWKLAKC